LEQDYRLPTVELHKDDIVWLWGKITELFEPSPGDVVHDGTIFKISAEIGEGRMETTVSDSDLDRLLGSGRIGDTLSGLTFFVSISYGPPRTNERRYVASTSSRQIWLSFGNVLGTTIRLKGNEDWIERVHGALDEYLRSKKRSKRAERWIIALVLSIVPTISLAYRASRQHSEALALLATILPIPLFAITFFVMEKMRPDNLILISDRAAGIPWYLDLAKQVLVGLVVVALVAILSALLWPL
jgi:hypothetical protein